MYDNTRLRRWIGGLTIRRLELVALGSTATAFVLTALLAGTGLAIETNGVAWMLIDTLGWTTTGVLALLGEALLLEGWRRLGPTHPRAALAGAGGIALVGLADTGINLWVLATVGLPSRVPWVLIEPIAVVSVFAIVLATWRDLTRIARSVSVPIGLIRATLTMVVALSISLSVVTPIPGGTVGATATTNTASSTILDDFESGDLSNWDGNSDWAVTSSNPIEGSYSAIYDKSEVASASESITYTSLTASKNVSFRAKVSNFGADANDAVFRLRDTNNADTYGAFYVKDGDISVYDGDLGGQTGAIASINPDDTYIYKMQTNLANNTYRTTLINVSTGETVFSNRYAAGTTGEPTQFTMFGYDDGADILFDKLATDDGLPTNSNTYRQTFELDDRTGLFPADRSTISIHEYNPGAHQITPTSDSFELAESSGFNADDKATFKLESGSIYKVSVERGGNVWELIGYVASDNDTEQTLTIESSVIDTSTPTPTPDPDATPTPTLAPGETPRPTSTPFPTEGPVYLGECSEPGTTGGISVEFWDPNYETSSFDYSIENDSGALFEGTKTFEEPIGYYRGCVGSAITNVSDPDAEEPTVDYSGGYTNGTSYSGSVNWTDSFDSGSVFGGGPVGSGGSSSSAATYGGYLLLAAGGYVAYRRYGSGELGSAISSASSSVGRLFGR